MHCSFGAELFPHWRFQSSTIALYLFFRTHNRDVNQDAMKVAVKRNNVFDIFRFFSLFLVVFSLFTVSKQPKRTLFYLYLGCNFSSTLCFTVGSPPFGCRPEKVAYGCLRHFIWRFVRKQISVFAIQLRTELFCVNFIGLFCEGYSTTTKVRKLSIEDVVRYNSFQWLYLQLQNSSIRLPPLLLHFLHYSR